MSKLFVIQWKSKVNGRAGKGTKCFDREEAERLAAELNREYPAIEHQSVPAASTVALSDDSTVVHALGEPTQSESHETTAEPAPLFSSS